MFLATGDPFPGPKVQKNKICGQYVEYSKQHSAPYIYLPVRQCTLSTYVAYLFSYYVHCTVRMSKKIPPEEL